MGTACTPRLSDSPTIDLQAGEYAVAIAPRVGSSISAFTFRNEPILRTAVGRSVLDSACFPLVPFSNRIANSRFVFEDMPVQLSPNHPEETDDPVLHGFGWLGEWSLEESGGDTASLVFQHKADRWPWHFRARSGFHLDADGLLLTLELVNRDERPMPAGLGFHPYFPRTPRTNYRGLHRGEWRAGSDCLPLTLEERAAPIDWWAGNPVGSRRVDTVYTGRQGNLEILWPERGLAAVVEPSDNLSFTTVYVPGGEDFFCVEPVSHVTNVFNTGRPADGMRVLAPGESLMVSMRIGARAID